MLKNEHSMEGRRLCVSDIPSVFEGFLLILVEKEGVYTKNCRVDFFSAHNYSYKIPTLLYVILVEFHHCYEKEIIV
jgi:hypothetical protein